MARPDDTDPVAGAERGGSAPVYIRVPGDRPPRQLFKEFVRTQRLIEGAENVSQPAGPQFARQLTMSTPVQNPTVPPVENPTDRRGDEPQIVAAS
jgi:hypothetical protein